MSSNEVAKMLFSSHFHKSNPIGRIEKNTNPIYNVVTLILLLLM